MTRTDAPCIRRRRRTGATAWRQLAAGIAALALAACGGGADVEPQAQFEPPRTPKSAVFAWLLNWYLLADFSRRYFDPFDPPAAYQTAVLLDFIAAKAWSTPNPIDAATFIWLGLNAAVRHAGFPQGSSVLFNAGIPPLTADGAASQAVQVLMHARYLQRVQMQTIRYN
jgi:hypothetical protein